MRRLLIAAFSTGWLFPMFLSFHATFSFLDLEVWPRLRGQVPGNSFPFITFAEQAFTVGVVWLAAVVFYWAWQACGAGKTRTHGN